jgi:hypothetical protein
MRSRKISQTRFEQYNTRVKHKKRAKPKDRVADVKLLQITLRSSQVDKLGKQMHLPVSRHWAVEIRGEVFELNRMESWTWSLTNGSISEREYPEWVNHKFASVYLSVLQSLSILFQLKPQAASRAQLDSCSYREYMDTREKWTQSLLLGTTDETQEWIKKRSKHFLYPIAGLPSDGTLAD